MTNEDQFENVVKHIIEAKKEALIHKIEANAFIINKNFAITQGFYCPELPGYMPPTICGLKVIYTNERLPFDSGFVLMHAEAIRAEFEGLKKENEELRKKLADLKNTFDKMED